MAFTVLQEVKRLGGNYLIKTFLLSVLRKPKQRERRWPLLQKVRNHT
jgi:hypothetical protein